MGVMFPIALWKGCSNSPVKAKRPKANPFPRPIENPTRARVQIDVVSRALRFGWSQWQSITILSEAKTLKKLGKEVTTG